MWVLLYWLGVKLYALAVRMASFFNPKASLFVRGRKRLLQQIAEAMTNEARPRIWMHCASLGEFEQGRPLLERLRNRYPGHALVLTFFSPSGYEVRKNYQGADYIYYLPEDGPRNARLFLKYIRPALCIFIKYELWYFYLSQLAAKDVPVLLVSAIFRKSQPFFKWYGSLHRYMLRSFERIFVQDAESERLLQTIGVDHVTIAGDTRFDRVLEASASKVSVTKAASFVAGSDVLIAGSTWPGDDKLLYEVMKKLPGNWKLILVPHDVHKDRIESIEERFGDIAVRWSAYQEDVTDKRVMIVDTVGLLLQLYGLGRVAWIGGGLDNGIHNVLEAAVYGIPVLHGPVYHKFLEARELIAAGGAIVYSEPGAVVALLEAWQHNDEDYRSAAVSAGNYVRSKTGATSKILAYLDAKNWLSTL